MTAAPARLLVLPPSHFCERARWGLDAAGIPYVEEAWAAGLHALRARRIAPATSLPILLVGGRAVQGSGAILDLCGLPGGAPEVERRFVERIGPLARQFVYAGTLADPRSGVLDLMLDGVPRLPGLTTRLAWPLLRRAIAAGLDARPELIPAIAGQIEVELAWFEAERDGRRHLVGDAFGRADLTAASLLSPLARPPELANYRGLRLPPALADRLDAWRERPALRWALDTYAQFRRT